MPSGRGVINCPLGVGPTYIMDTIAVYTRVLIERLDRGPVQRNGVRAIYGELCEAHLTMMKLNAHVKYVPLPDTEQSAPTPKPGKAKNKVSIAGIDEEV